MINYEYSYVILDANVYITILNKLYAEYSKNNNVDYKSFIQSKIDSLKSSVESQRNVMFDTVRKEVIKVIKEKYRYVDKELLEKFFSVFNFIQPFFQFNEIDKRFIKIPEKDELGKFKSNQKDQRRDQIILLTCKQNKIGNFVTFNYRDGDFEFYYKRFYDDFYKGLKIYKPKSDFSGVDLYPWIINECFRKYSNSLAGKLLRLIESFQKHK